MAVPIDGANRGLRVAEIAGPVIRASGARTDFMPIRVLVGRRTEHPEASLTTLRILGNLQSTPRPWAPRGATWSAPDVLADQTPSVSLMYVGLSHRCKDGTRRRPGPWPTH
jgi:hypothetical protein